MSENTFAGKHLGTRTSDAYEMLNTIGCNSVSQLIDEVIPQSIQQNNLDGISNPLSENDYLQSLKEIGKKNKIFKTYIGQGFYGTITPSVIKRNILENPSWYTSYTPYQAEISQGRLEALLNFQTMIKDLTAMEIANASLLDEASAAAEAMIMLFNNRSRTAIKAGANQFLVDTNIFRQNLDVLRSRAKALNIELIEESYNNFELSDSIFGAIVQYPAADGEIIDYRSLTRNAEEKSIPVAVIADLLSLTILTPPGEWGADVVVGSTQRFGLPLGYGGPHAAFFATKEKYIRKMPGRIIGISENAEGNMAYRMTLQTREQHIKREKATSNICTAQALLANMSGMYAVFHGKEGLIKIANQIHYLTNALQSSLQNIGYTIANKNLFDTISINCNSGEIQQIRTLALGQEINLFYLDNEIRISIDELTTEDDINKLIGIFCKSKNQEPTAIDVKEEFSFSKEFQRTSDFLCAEVFKIHRTETELMRYIKKLERKDISLTHSMIPLGSCTMKLNSATSMLPLSWDEFGALHPFIPRNQAQGFIQMISEIEADLCKITGFAKVSMQPNSGAAGELAGLLTIRSYHEHNNQHQRTKVLIPASAHGTNPASAIMAGMSTVTIKCDENGNICLEDLKQNAEKYKDELACAMITYPSTHGVFEDDILEMTATIHQYGGLVYMDGANMNAQVGLTNPAKIGADVCHLNLHKTFGIPHGGGGPGIGPIATTATLKDFLPQHYSNTDSNTVSNAVSSTPYGNASANLITHAYIKMLGADGLKEATEIAILNANYLASKLKQDYSILYLGSKGRCAHELIVDCREFKTLGIEVVDIAKRLMDYGFHAPTVSFPVPGTLMIEPTESESKEELDRFIEAMSSIKEEINKIENDTYEADESPLKNAPHTETILLAEKWDKPYSRLEAAYPLEWIKENKFWPGSSRINDAFGDRNLKCCC